MIFDYCNMEYEQLTNRSIDPNCIIFFHQRFLSRSLSSSFALPDFLRNNNHNEYFINYLFIINQRLEFPCAENRNWKKEKPNTSRLSLRVLAYKIFSLSIQRLASIVNFVARTVRFFIVQIAATIKLKASNLLNAFIINYYCNLVVNRSTMHHNNRNIVVISVK